MSSPAARRTRGTTPRPRQRPARPGGASRSADRILDAVCAIPLGFVCTYGDLSPGSPRFAGRVLHATTQELPWWRVVRADGSLPLGEDQRRRLDAEGVPLAANDPPRVDMSRARLPHPRSPEA